MSETTTSGDGQEVANGTLVVVGIAIVGVMGLMGWLLSPGSSSLSDRASLIAKQICNEAMKQQMGRYGQYLGGNKISQSFLFKYGPVDCFVTKDRVLWKNRNGRMRNTKSWDTKITVDSVSDDLRTFNLRFAHPDGSGSTKQFKSGVSFADSPSKS